MRTRAILLVVTLGLNAALGVALWRQPGSAPATVRRLLADGTSPTGSGPHGAVVAPTRTAASSASARPAPAATLWSALDTDDLRTLVARLRAAGFPPHQVRAVLEAKLGRVFQAKYLALLTEANGGSLALSYWKTDVFSGGLQQQKFWDQQSQLYRERSRQLRDLMGDDLAASYGVPAATLNNAYGKLPREKIELIQRINDDYSEMTQQVRSSMLGIMLPEDREKIALLEREKRADLAALLTPEERAEYEQRTSRITTRLRPALTLLDSSEAEFRAIYGALQPFEDRLYPTASGPDNADSRREAQKQAAAQVKAVLGEARYAEYERASLPEFQQLSRLAQRENIPAATTVQAFALRDAISRDSNRIFDDATLSNEAKRAALQALAQSTRAQLTSLLGPTVGPAYADSAKWLVNVGTGRAVVFTDGVATFRRVPGAATPPP